MNAPLLSIMSEGQVLQFALQGEFSDGYTNELKAMASEFKTHPPLWQWEKGSIDDLELELVLAVGVGWIDTPQKLVDTIAKLYSMSLAKPASAKRMLPKVVVSVGSWYARKGFMKSVKAKFSPPWDVDSSMPMTATVTMTFAADFSPVPNLDKLPKAPWGFDTSEGSF